VVDEREKKTTQSFYDFISQNCSFFWVMKQSRKLSSEGKYRSGKRGVEMKYDKKRCFTPEFLFKLYSTRKNRTLEL